MDGFFVRWDIVGKYLSFLMEGLPTTFFIAAIALVLGLLIGFLIVILRLSRAASFRIVGTAYVEVFRNVPVYVQLVWWYYVLPIATGVALPALASCGLALGLYSASYFAEAYRSGIQAIPAGQVEAGRSIGMSRGQVMRWIVLPQALRIMVPTFASLFVLFLKTSSLVAIIGVQDLMYKANVASSESFRPIEIYTTIAVIYFVICYTLSLGAAYLERTAKAK